MRLSDFVGRMVASAPGAVSVILVPPDESVNPAVIVIYNPLISVAADMAQA